MLSKLKIIVSKKHNGTYQAESSNDYFGTGKTRGEALKNLAEIIEKADKRREDMTGYTVYVP